MTATEPLDPARSPSEEDDAQRLRELGYEQELKRGMGIFDSVAMGFATISPVVGLYAVVLVGMVVAGAAWVWVLPVALAGQCLLIAVYAELAGKFPLANGAYQWSRRLVGPRYGWFNGWVALCAYAVANTTIAYAGAFWALALLGIAPTATAVVIAGAVLVAICSLVNAIGVDALKASLRFGVAAEAIASVGIGLALLLVFREQDFSVLFELRRRAPGRQHGRRVAGRARGRRLGVHRLRRDGRRGRGDPRRGRTSRARSGSRC